MTTTIRVCFSALQRAEIAEILSARSSSAAGCRFSALQRAEIAEIGRAPCSTPVRARVSVLFNEPKLLKCQPSVGVPFGVRPRFSALQRAEIAEIDLGLCAARAPCQVSVLFNEPKLLKSYVVTRFCQCDHVSVLFNEPKLLKYLRTSDHRRPAGVVSVLFNEPKLLKFYATADGRVVVHGFSALQRAEIAEILAVAPQHIDPARFQCSSTSRNC